MCGGVVSMKARSLTASRRRSPRVVEARRILKLVGGVNAPVLNTLGADNPPQPPPARFALFSSSSLAFRFEFINSEPERAVHLSASEM